jgi:hypothetical protein
MRSCRVCPRPSGDDRVDGSPPPPDPAAWQRTRAIVPIVAIATFAAVSLYAGYVHHGPLLHV